MNSNDQIPVWRFDGGKHRFREAEPNGLFSYALATITPPDPNSVAWDRDLWVVKFFLSTEPNRFETLEEAKAFVGRHLKVDASGLSLPA